MRAFEVHSLAMRTSGPEQGKFSQQGAENNWRTINIHTGDVGVRTEIKGTIVVFGWTGTVCRNILPNLLGKIEVVDHVLRDRAVVRDERGGVEARIVIRHGETFDVWRENWDVRTVSHVTRGEGGIESATRPLTGYKSKGRRNADASGAWAAAVMEGV